MATVTRRRFLAGMTAAAGVATLPRPRLLAAEAPAKVRRASDVVALGKTGLRPTLLGIGTCIPDHTGTVGTVAIGQDAFTRLLRHGLDRGVRYIDTADSYKTHSMIRKALAGVARDKYFLLSKSFAKTPERMKADVDRILKELGTDYLDSFLMHCQTTGDWPSTMRDVQGVLRDMKQQGKIKSLGVSIHGWDPLAVSPQAEGIDVELVRINPFGLIMDDKPEKVVPVLRKMHADGRGIIGMKVFGVTGLKSRQERLQSIKYVLGLGCVDCFTIGFRSIEQLDETMKLIEEAG